MADALTLVVVGAASRDVDTADARGWRLGGTVTYACIAAARLGVRVRALMGVDPEAAAASELTVLRHAGVELLTVPIQRGPVFDNRQTPAGRIQHVLSASDVVPLVALPEEWGRPEGALLGPVAGELDDEWAAAFPATTYVALTAQGLVRRLTPGETVHPLPLRPGPLWRRADAALISAEDVAGGTPPLSELLRPGQQLLVTHGVHGALQISHNADSFSARYAPPLPRRDATDTTGAGDTFLAAWLSARLVSGRTDWRALAVASAMASLALDRASLDATPTLAQLCDVLVRRRDQHLG